MRTRIFALIAGLVMAVCAAAGVESLSTQDATSGLREVLVTGAQYAVESLGKQDGFMGNAKVRIQLPESARKVEKILRQLGMGKQADELLLAINRAAEAAVPEAKALLVDAVRKMSVQDAKAILMGGQDSGTQYFKRTSSEQLRAKFLPIVKRATAKVQLAQKYDEYAGKGAKLGLIKEEDANLDRYVTQKTLDGLFVMVAEQEAKIRQNPAEAAGALLRRVFGALK